MNGTRTDNEARQEEFRLQQDQTKDYLVRGTAWDGKLRVFAVTTTALS